MKLTLSAALPLLLSVSVAAQTPTALEDADHGFRLRSPGDGWRLLDAKAVKSVQPLAAAGARSPAGVYGVVVVEPAPDQPLLEIGRALVRSSLLDDLEVDAFEGFDLCGRPAVHWTLSGTSGDKHFLHDLTLLENGGDLFRLVAWSDAADRETAERDFRAFRRAFELLGGAPDPGPATRLTPDGQGVDWRIQRGIWQSPPCGLQVVPRGGWRVVAGEELATLDTRARVGLHHEESRTTLLVFAGTWIESEQRAWRSQVRADSETIGEPLNESVLVDLDGHEAELRMYTAFHSGDDGERMRQLAGELARGEDCFELLAWYPIELEGEALAALHAGFASLHLMEADTRAAVAREALATSPAIHNRVGDGFSLRQDVYRDFRFGLRWRRPDTTWDVTVGEAADVDEPGAVMTLHSAAHGVRAALFVSPVSSVPREDWHELAIDRAGDGRTVERVGATRTVELGEVEALVTVAERGGGRPTRTWVATTENASWAFELRMSGSPGILEREADALDAALAAFEITRTAEGPTATTSRAHYDDRLGFQIQSPGEGFRFGTEGSERFWPSGGVARWRDDGNEVSVLALCGARLADGLVFHTSLVRNSLPPELAPLLARDPAVTETTFAGVPAHELLWRDADHTVRTFVFERGHTLFLVHSLGAPAAGGKAVVEPLFQFLP